MDWIFDKPELEAFRINALHLPNYAAAMCHVSEYDSILVEHEQQTFDKMSAAKRRRSFSSGRHCVRMVQNHLGMKPEAIGREGRAPIWPQGKGSITHSDQIAAAVLGTGNTSLGVDIEQIGRVEQQLWRLIFTESERHNLHKLNSTAADTLDLATLVFSAKEAGYKAIYPVGKAFINFHDAEVDLDLERQSFAIRYLGQHKPNQALNEGFGYFQFAHQHVITFFGIDLCKR